VTRHAALLAEHGDLSHRLGDDPEHQVVSDLDESRDLALADVRRTLAKVVEQVLDLVKGDLGARDDEAERTGLDDLAVPADRRGEEVDAELGRGRAHRCGGLHRDRRGVDDDTGDSAGVGEQPALAEKHLLEVGRGRDHGEDDIKPTKFRDVVGDGAAKCGERLRLGARAVPDSDVVACPGQAPGHRRTHPPGADPADLQ
jgi:hypothetical protein